RIAGHERRGPPRERRGHRALVAALDGEQRERELPAACGERPRRGCDALALRERALEGREPLAGRPCLVEQAVPLGRRGARGGPGPGRRRLELVAGRASARGRLARLGHRRAKLRHELANGLVAHGEPLVRAAQADEEGARLLRRVPRERRLGPLALLARSLETAGKRPFLVPFG